jgi:hypothetical protein
VLSKPLIFEEKEHEALAYTGIFDRRRPGPERLRRQARATAAAEEVGTGTGTGADARPET